MPREDTQFKPGHPGGPGRPEGGKNKLGEFFLRALVQDFEEHGEEAIERMREKSPGEYVRVIAGLMPKEFLLEVSREENPRWVINAHPMSIEEWQEKHGLNVLESADHVKP
jgi:hypothetical protein